MLTAAMIGLCLGEHWALERAGLTCLEGGMGSRAWIVDHDDRRWVAKAVVVTLGSQFAGGLAVAQRLERAGIPAGAPEPTRDGSLTVTIDGYRLALLTWVPGDELTGHDQHQQWLIGATLGRVHRALAGQVIEGARRFHWVDPAADHLALRPWLRPAITAAVEALEHRSPDAWSQGLLHTDPAPEAFRLNPVTGTCGVIDWSVALYGPLLYDLASAVMYLGGPDRAAGLIEAYQAHGALGRVEIDDGLPLMLRFRWAVQADYFARRITQNDLTGIAGPQDNEKGLEDARRFLIGWPR